VLILAEIAFAPHLRLSVLISGKILSHSVDFRYIFAYDLSINPGDAMSPEINLLTTLSTQPFSGCEDQWKDLLRSLHLSIAHVPAIQAVLEKGRWKRQPNPMAYVRKSSLRCAARLGIIDVRRNSRREVLATDLNFKDAQAKPMGHDDRLGTALHRHDGLGAEYGSIYDEENIINRLPDSVLDENLDVKWEHVADLAQMDSGERIVLKLQRAGFGRRPALDACFTDKDRKLLEAAWKRFDRNKETLKGVLMTGRPKPIQRVRPGPKAGSKAETWIELIFIQVPGKGMKISFRKHVPSKPE
jgi:hypothetical protein